MNGVIDLSGRTSNVNIFTFCGSFLKSLFGNKRSTSLPVDYRIHGTHEPQNVIQILTLKKFRG